MRVKAMGYESVQLIKQVCFLCIYPNGIGNYLEITKILIYLQLATFCPEKKPKMILVCYEVSSIMDFFWILVLF